MDKGKKNQIIDIFWTTLASIIAGGLMLWFSVNYDSTHILSYIWKMDVYDIAVISDKTFQILLAQYQLTFLIISIVTILGNKDEVLLWEDLIQKILVTPRFRNLIDLTIYSFTLLIVETIAFIISQYLLAMICFGLTAVILIYMILKVLKIYFGRNVFMEKMYKQYSVNTMLGSFNKAIVKSKIFKKDLKEELIKCIESGNKNLETLYDKTILAINNSDNLFIRENMSFFLSTYKETLNLEEVLREDYEGKLFRRKIMISLLNKFKFEEMFYKNKDLIDNYKYTIQYYMQWLYKDIASNNIIFFTQLITEASEEYDFIINSLEYTNILVEALENQENASSVKARIIETCIKLENKKESEKENLIMDYIADSLNKHIKNDDRADVIAMLDIIDLTINQFKRGKQSEDAAVTVFSSASAYKLLKTVGEVNPKYDFDYIKLKNGDEDYYTFNLEDDEEDSKLSEEEYVLKYSEDDLSTYDRYMNWLKWLIKYETQYYSDYHYYIASIESSYGMTDLEEPIYLIAGFREYTNALVLKLETPKNRKILNDMVDDLEKEYMKH